MAAYAGKIKLAGAIGFGVPLLAWLGLLVPLFKARPESLHGDASLSGLPELRKAGLLKQTPQSILVGKYQSQYKTIRRQNRSVSRGRGASQVSINYTEGKRALCVPQEIKELPAADELIFYEGCKPIRAKKNWFFKDKLLEEAPPCRRRRSRRWRQIRSTRRPRTTSSGWSKRRQPNGWATDAGGQVHELAHIDRQTNDIMIG